MGLEIDREGVRKQQLFEVLSHITEASSDIAEASIVFGSCAYNWDHQLFATSDLDLMFVCQRLRAEALLIRLTQNGTLSGPVPNFEAYQTDTVDVLGVKSVNQTIPISIHLVPPDIFNTACTFNRQTFRSLRNVPKEGSTRFYNFQGQSIDYRFVNQPTETGVYHEVPAYVIKDNTYYTGIMHGRLLHAPKVVFDHNGEIENQLGILWSLFLDRLISENPNGVDLTKSNPLFALKNSKYFSPALKEAIAKKTIAYLSALRIPYMEG